MSRKLIKMLRRHAWQCNDPAKVMFFSKAVVLSRAGREEARACKDMARKVVGSPCFATNVR